MGVWGVVNGSALGKCSSYMNGAVGGGARLAHDDFKIQSTTPSESWGLDKVVSLTSSLEPIHSGCCERCQDVRRDQNTKVDLSG